MIGIILAIVFVAIILMLYSTICISTSSDKKLRMRITFYLKSIGNSTTTPRDLENDEDVKIVLYVLAESVAARLRENL